MFFNEYPYRNLTDLNLDFLLKAIGEMQNEVKNFVTLNAVKYADPIQWNITTQYEKNTIVIDPITGTAYISVQPVPSGVALNRTEYWTPVFDLSRFITQANKNFTSRVEPEGVIYSTYALNVGDWVIWNSALYKALVNMPVGTAYSVGSNIERITVEEFIVALNDAINNEIADRKSADLTLQGNIDAEALTRSNADNTLQGNIDAEALARGNADTTLQNEIGVLNNLNTTNKDNLVSAINEVNTKASAANYYVTPEDYGATGGADDTAAVQAAINDGRPVIFTQNYNITSITIPNDSTRTIHIDGKNRWLNYVGDGSETAAVIMKGVNVTIENLNINNKTSHEKIGMYWTSDDAAHPSEFNYIRGMNIYNFNTGIFYGEINGALDTSQSENYISNYNTRGCHLPIFMYMENAILTIDSSNLICSHAESLYTWNDNTSGIARVESGLLIISNSELVKPDITAGFGIQGKNVHIDNCAIEIASVWANCSGDITFSNISAGYFGGGDVLSPFYVYPDADGVLTLNNIDLRIGTVSSVPLVNGMGSYPTSFYCNIINSKFNNRIWNYATPICDCPFSIKNTIINNVLLDDETYNYNSLNYTDFVPNGVSQSVDAVGNVVITANAANPSVTTEDFRMSTLLDFSVEVVSMSGAWTAILVVTAPDGTISYPSKALHLGINDLPLMYGAIAAKSAKLSIVGASIGDSITIKKILVNSNGIK